MVKLLEENIGAKLFDLSLGHDFMDITPNAQATETKIGKPAYKSFREPTMNRVKRQLAEWEKILAKHIDDHLSKACLLFLAFPLEKVAAGMSGISELMKLG